MLEANSKAFIVEDEKRNMSVLKGLLKMHCPIVHVVGEAGNVEDAINALSAVQPEIVFMDIELGDKLSFEILDKISERNFSVIFVTAFDHYAVRAFKYAAIDYLMKPVNHMELIAAVERSISNKNKKDNSDRIDLLLQTIMEPKQKNQRIALPTKEGLIFIDVKDIIKLEADGSYTIFHFLQKNTLMVSKPLREYEEFLEVDNFMRVHHSFIINLAQVKKYVRGSGGHVIMNDDSLVDVSVRKKDDFLKRVRL
ncbi:MAG: LytTR family DNA-binding domain-containing protein [Bacteroidota bacterium]|nr:LytTR family DNA-binding domain-containing protein [Bacteroidota bacterium]